jgi:hypothetical protein
MNNVSVRYHGGIITVWQNYRNCVQNIDTKLYLQFVPMMRQQQISRYMNKHLSDSYTLRFSLMFIDDTKCVQKPYFEGQTIICSKEKQ